MSKNFKILVINPGSTSTKIAVFKGKTQMLQEQIRHSSEELACYKRIIDEKNFRTEIIAEVLKQAKINISNFDAVVGRGGLLKPLEGGTYRVNRKMLEDLVERPRREHASNLGAIIAYEIARQIGVSAFIVDGVSVDEFHPVARISGIPEIERESLWHALNQKAVGRIVAQRLSKRFALDKDKTYKDFNFIIVHLGGGISVAAHRKGRAVDVNDATASGPFASQRAGGLPSEALVNLCFSEKFSKEEMLKKLIGQGGLVAYLGTNNAQQVEEMIVSGNKHAELIYKAMAYQVAKVIGAMAVVLNGKVDAIILTGQLAKSKLFTGWIKERVKWISWVEILPGSFEMKALALGALRVLKGEEEAQEYR